VYSEYIYMTRGLGQMEALKVNRKDGWSRIEGLLTRQVLSCKAACVSGGVYVRVV
jgi:hypothetical protein